MGGIHFFPGENDEAHLYAGLRSSETLLAEHLASVTRVYGNYGLGMVELPNLGTPGQIAPAQVNSGAVLYWCSEVDKAGILPFVETLADKLFTGQFQLPIQQSSSLLRPFWRSAEHRFTEPERLVLYRQVLDGNMPGSFQQHMLHLSNSLVSIGREAKDHGILHLQARAAQSIQNLAQGLSDRSVGITGFAARDIVRQIRDAMDILNNPEINRALGGGSISFILQRWSPSLMNRQLNVSPHLRLAQHGVSILRWIAREAPLIVQNSSMLGRQHPLMHEAEAWLATYSGIREP